jgi:hypothetical protein
MRGRLGNHQPEVMEPFVEPARRAGKPETVVIKSATGLGADR